MYTIIYMDISWGELRKLKKKELLIEVQKFVPWVDSYQKALWVVTNENTALPTCK